ncbi:hypothetical protein M9Y10_033538 [Tritrichomonas musculus]|uniref:Protein kinase domain-containing protein n=1 Tax=Tritrichomonas musculus TaxID=1915356 RepID=A0ABR2KCK3_9EUKA
MKLMMTDGIGTPRYMAPELFDDDDSVLGPTIDVYAFGMIAYEVMTGREPFSELPRLNAFILSQKVYQGYRPPFTENVTKEMRELIERCWSQVIEERPSFKEIFNLLTSNISKFANEKIDEEEVNRFIDKLKEFKEVKTKKIEDDDLNIDQIDDFEKMAVFQDKNSVFYNLFDKSKIAEITDSSNVSGNIFIPAFIRFGSSIYKVTNICDKAFASSSIKSLSFSHNSKLESVGNSVFEKSSIQTVFLPKSLTKVDPLWIKGADNLVDVDVNPENIYFNKKNDLLFKNNEKEIVFASRKFKGTFSVPKGTKKICDYSFSNVQNLLSFESLFSSLNEIGSYSFFKCEHLKTVVIHQENSISFSSFCFSNCRKLSTVEVTCKSFKTSDNCFNSCDLLTSFKVETSEEVKLHQETFKGCHNLQEILFNKSSKIDIENDHFCWPENLKLVSFNEVKEVILGHHTFKNAKNLENILITKSSQVIVGHECFVCSFALKNIEFITDSIILGESFACKCPSLQQVDIQCKNDIIIPIKGFDQTNTIKSMSLKTQSSLILPNYFLSDSTSLEKIVISGKNVKIGDFSFGNCTSLTNFEIINSGTIELGMNEFVNCSNLYQINIKSELNSDVKFGQNCFGGCNGLRIFNLNGGNLIIKNDCFKSNESLTHLFILKANKIVIYDDQFINSKSIQTITLDSETETKLGNNCFSGSEKLEMFQLFSKGDITVNTKSFTKCKKLTFSSLNAGSNLTLSDKSFSESSIEKIELNGQDVTICNDCFHSCKSLKELIFSKIKNLTLYSHLFNMCNQLESIQIEIHQTLKIKSECFCLSNVKKVNIQANAVEIENDAFRNNKSINSIFIGAISIKLSKNVFENCVNLRKIELASTSDLFIDENCFSCCRDLNSYVLNGNSIIIGKLSFFNCNKLNKLTLQRSDQVIFGEKVFEGCNNIDSINIVAPTKFEAGLRVQISSKTIDNLEEFSILECNCVKLGQKAFNGCSKLIITHIGSGQIFIGDFCFLKCNKLSQIGCLSATQINYFETAFNKQNFIKHNSEAKIVIENK